MVCCPANKHFVQIINNEDPEDSNGEDLNHFDIQTKFWIFFLLVIKLANRSRYFLPR